MASHNTGHSGTGVFYQAMPAVGADGRNVMKLIPVQKVNGQFVPSKISPHKKDVAEPPRAVTLNFDSKPVVRSVPAFQSSDSRQIVKTQLSAINGVPHPGSVAGRRPEVGILKNNLQSSMQNRASLAGSRAAQGSTPSTPKSGTFYTLLGSGQLPVTVKSPVLPSGQYLQIPPTAQVKTLPMSALPPAIKRQIVTSTANATSNSKLPTVLYVSPVQTMNEGGPQQCPTAAPFPNRLQKTPDQTPSASSSVPSTQSTRSVVKDSQKPVTPMRWVIEEQDGSPAPCLVPVNSSSMVSDILKTLADIERAKKHVHESTAKKPQCSQATLPKTGNGAQNALVMCNGKVYFVANKTRELCNLKAKPSETIGNVTSTGGSPGSQRVSALPSMPTNASVQSQASNKGKPQSDFIVIPDGPDEVIDLCDDDSQDDLSPHAISIPEKTRSLKTQTEAEDEDSNVIFVSYMPPKLSELSGAELEKAPMNNLKTRLETVSKDIANEQKPMGTQGSETGLSKESRQGIDKTQDMASSRVSATYPGVNICQAKITDRGRDTNQSKVSGMKMKGSCITSTSLGVEISADVSKETVPSQHIFTLDMVNRQAVLHDHGTEKRLHNITWKDNESTQRHTHLQKPESQQIQNVLDPSPVGLTSVHEQDSLKTCDHQLKKMFGITSDVKIHLERVNAKKPEATPIPQIGPSAKHILKGISELIQVSKVAVKKRGHKEMQVCFEGTNETSPKDGKKMKMEIASKATEDSKNMESLITQSRQPETCLLNTSVGSENTNKSLRCSSSPTEILCDAEAEQRFGHEEPVNDFLSTAESEIYALPLSVLDTPHIPKLSSYSPVPFVQPQTNVEAKDCSVEVCSAASNNLETKPKRRRGRQRKCLACPNGTHEGVPVSSPPTAQKKSCSSKPADCSPSTIPEQSELRGVSTKEQREDDKPASVEVQCLSTMNEQSSCTSMEMSASDLFCTAPMDPDEIKRHEKIRRLKELLREKEAALEKMRKNIA